MKDYFLLLGTFLCFDLKKKVKGEEFPYAIGSVLQYIAGIKENLMEKEVFKRAFGDLVMNPKTSTMEPKWYHQILDSTKKGYNDHYIVEDAGGDARPRDDPDEVIYNDELGDQFGCQST